MVVDTARPAGAGSEPATRTPVTASPSSRAAVLFLASRLCVLIAVVGSVLIAQRYGDTFANRPWPAPAQATPFERVATMWDGSWYLDVARHGYPSDARGPAAARIAFFPLFPAVLWPALRLSGGIGIDVNLVLVLALGLVGAIAVAALATELLPDRVADRAVALYCFFPGAFVLSLPYSEVLVIPLTAVALLATLRERWVLAGLMVGLVTATRPNGIALLVAVGVASVLAVRRGRGMAPLLAPALGALGAVSFFAGLWIRTGELTSWWRVQHDVWHEQFRPLLATVDRVRSVAGGIPSGAAGRELDAVVALTFLVFALGGAVLLVRWRPPLVITVYTVAVLVLAESSQTIGMRPRFVLSAFPLFFALARELRGQWFTAVIGIFVAATVGLVLMSALTLSITP